MSPRPTIGHSMASRWSSGLLALPHTSAAGRAQGQLHQGLAQGRKSHSLRRLPGRRAHRPTAQSSNPSSTQTSVTGTWVNGQIRTLGSIPIVGRLYHQGLLGPQQFTAGEPAGAGHRRLSNEAALLDCLHSRRLHRGGRGLVGTDHDTSFHRPVKISRTAFDLCQY
jgi:hypothetical protein